MQQLFGKFDDRLHELLQPLRFKRQTIEVSQRFLIAEGRMDRFDALVVVHADGAELGVKARQPDVEVVGVLVPDDDREGSPEDAVADEIGFVFHPGLFVHPQKPLVLLAVQADVIAVYAGIVEGLAACGGGRFGVGIHRASVF